MTVLFRYSVMGGSSFLSSIQPTITISSMSELTGVAAVDTETRPEKKDEYVVVNPADQLGTTPPLRSGRGGGGGGGGELKLSLHGEEHSVSPSQSPPVLSLPFSPGHQMSFTVVSDRDIIRALPVGGLSSAADVAQDLELDNGKDVRTNEEARALFENEHTCHFDAVMIQSMKSCGISLGWLKVVKPLVMEVTQKVKTNVYPTDTMNVKEYVKVKKIPGGRRSDSTLINGVVCTKNITHKKMKVNIRNPTVLLLKCAFEFQRKENQLSSFDTLQMQEEKYLKNLVARVKTFQPRVILVQKSVARLALDMFYHLDIVVAVNVKPSVMERVARSTQGDLLHSLDQLFFNVQLGTCGQFYLHTFALPDGVKKTLMYFDLCDPRLGCAITLMGGTRRELKKVKKVTLFGVFVAYNSLLESSFLIDEFAWPASHVPHQPPPDVEGYSSSPSTPEWPLHPSVSHPIDGIPPTELARKLEALVPELKEEVTQRQISSVQSTPTVPRSKFGQRHLNAIPMMSPNSRSYSISGFRNEALGAFTNEEGVAEGGKFNRPFISRSFDDIRSSSDPLSLHYQAPPTAGVDPATLFTLGTREFEAVMSSQLLSITPGVKFPVPYLQTPQGFEADLRKYLPSVIYWSHQFFAVTQTRSKSSKKKKKKGVVGRVSLSPDITTTSTVEMGIRRDYVEEAVQLVQNRPPLPPTVTVSTAQGVCDDDHSPRSYRSISEHPFTSSIFLLKANTNEMRAALADYRANSGLPNPSLSFFFPTASQASDYRMHLQNIFNKYKEFEVARGEVEEGEGNKRERGGEESLSGAEKGKSKKKLRQRARRHNTPSSSGSGKKADKSSLRGSDRSWSAEPARQQERANTIGDSDATYAKKKASATENFTKRTGRYTQM